ncbi:NAD-dependent epimerase/dehydratase family protein [Streptomyces sp. DSM 41524]|uniref:NAD-dependent epimerase/dehydratase family protein n=1 Tax=Streptomyces asiaticus subsp. ignotus TaxID=3098222 RepID=A0ABU7Q546_9ACTN|nr:NAD-dependent epimerase/dehydratase family protein [Streptomyces sp. DSM 41524]
MTHTPLKALVTGALGFIGTPLCRRLLERGDTVTMLDLPPKAPSDLIGHSSASYHSLDLTRESDWERVIRGHDVVFHLAANTENRPGMAGRLADYEHTVGATVRLLYALGDKEPTTFVLTSSQLVYGGRAGRAREADPVHPQTTFAAGKVAAEAFLCAYANATHISAVACRLANVIGPGIRRGVVADLVHRLREDPDKLQVLGNGQQRRSYVHVDDCVAALLVAAATAQPGFGILNVSNTDTLTAAEVASVVAAASPGLAPAIEYSGGSAWQGDATALHPDASKLAALGWKPQHTSREAVSSTAQSLFGGSTVQGATT